MWTLLYRPQSSKITRVSTIPCFPDSSDPTWTQTTWEDFIQGTLENVVVTGDGDLQLDNNELEVDDNTVALWHFNEYGGAVAYDNSSKNNTGTLVGSGPRWTSGKFENGLRFENTGTPEYVKIPYSSSLNFISGDFTVECWVKPAASYPTAEDGWRVFVRQDNTSGDIWDYSWVLGYEEWNDLVAFEFKNSAGSTYKAQYPMSLNADTWYHIAGVKEGTDLKLYINGELRNTAALSGDYPAPEAIYIGGWKEVSAGAMEAFNGTIDEVRIENRSPTGTENYPIYNDAGFVSGVNWYTWSDGDAGSFDASSTAETPPEGTKSFETKTNSGSWAGWGAHVGDKDLSSYSGGHLKFWVKTAYNLKVEVEDTGGNRGPLYIGDYGWNGENTWQPISIPLDDFSGFDLGHVKYLFKITVEGGTYRLFYLDHLKWTPSDNASSNEIAGNYENDQELDSDESTVGLWHMNEGADNCVGDSSACGNDGSSTECPIWKGGKFGSALWFNGSEYVRVENDASLNPTQEITVECWAYFYEQPALNSAQTIVSKNFWGGSWNVKGYILKIETDSSNNFKITWGVGSTGSEWGTWVSYQTTFEQGWYHIVGVADGSNAILYVDGTNVNQGGYSGNLNWCDNDLTVGCEAFNLQNFFKGMIDEIRIENRALSPTEIAQHAKNYKPSGVYTSAVKDAEEIVMWDIIEFDNTTPPDTSVVVRTRSSSDNSDWSDWVEAENGSDLPWENRYLQYIIEFTGGVQTPVISEVRISYSSPPVVIDVEINKLPKWSDLPKSAVDRIADPDNGNPMEIIIKSTTSTPTKAQVKGSDNLQKTGTYPDYIGIDNVGMSNGTTSYRDNGTLYGDAAWTSGKLDNALVFDGSGDYVAIPHSDELAPAGGLPNLSVEMWIYPENFSSGQPRLLIKRGDTWPPTNGWDIYLENGGAGEELEKLDLVVVIKPTGNYWGVSAKDNITANAWNHIVVTYNGSNGQIIIYINGSEVTYDTWASGGSGNIVSDTENSLYIGRYTTDVSTRYFRGKIDEVRLENRVLTASEVADHYNSGSGRRLWVDDNTLAVWHFDEGTGSTCYDGGPILRLSTSYQDIPWLTSIAVPSGDDNTQNVYLFIRTREDQMGGTYNGTIWVKLVSTE
ncbi:MAG: LamG domain-containing protein [Candidatus Hadarchaeales archaeon]